MERLTRSFPLLRGMELCKKSRASLSTPIGIWQSSSCVCAFFQPARAARSPGSGAQWKRKLASLFSVRSSSSCSCDVCACDVLALGCSSVCRKSAGVFLDAMSMFASIKSSRMGSDSAEFQNFTPASHLVLGEIGPQPSCCCDIRNDGLGVRQGSSEAMSVATSTSVSVSTNTRQGSGVGGRIFDVTSASPSACDGDRVLFDLSPVNPRSALPFVIFCCS